MLLEDVQNIRTCSEDFIKTCNWKPQAWYVEKDRILHRIIIELCIVLEEALKALQASSKDV